ncbi:exo-alpha-sialidase [Telmatocola sphagniphila]|uniref:Exo-alpha-sialidase n=1 Tax=Telmatocola sphagniphila TaxID=1123043 RepID=A0A8E6EYX1_9BACT|nr:sialidase family protein [Telmatocola sphagniphila]QVL32801.1 exo-alpha-sialidase [Telmatocola sphagniphila]
MKTLLILLLFSSSLHAEDQRKLEIAKQPGYVRAEFIYESAPFPQCHASTIVETSQGLVAAWFGGTREKNPDVCIWLSRQENGKWTAPVRVADGIQSGGKQLPCWNPVLFQPEKGPLMLFYKVGPSPDTWWGMLKTSTDCGITWGEPRRLPEGILGPIKNKPVQLSNGDILCPTSDETKGWRVHFERSSDGGKTWNATEPVNTKSEASIIQPSILLRGKDQLLAVGRSQQRKIFQIASSDNGLHWGKVRFLDLPNPNSGTDAVTLKDGRQLLVYNHTPLSRSPLNVAVSENGETWKAAMILENDPFREFSYPAVIQTRDGLVHITYTWKRERVRHVVLDPNKFVLKEFKSGVWPD